MSTLKQSGPALWKLLLLVCFCAIGAVVVAPAIGDIARYLNIEINHAEKMMSFYLCGYALGQIVYGPLAEALGDKKALMIGAWMALLGALACLVALAVKSFVLFLIARFIMALGSAAGLVISFILLNNQVSGEALRRKMSLLFSSIALAVPTMTALSGYVQVRWGWPSTFWIFILYSVLIIALVMTFSSQSRQGRKKLLSVELVANRYFLMMANKKLLINAISYGCCATILYTFSTLSPVITVEILGLSPDLFGLLNYVPYFGLLIGTVLSAILSTSRKTNDVIELGFCSVGSGVALLLVSLFLHQEGARILFGSMFLIFAGIGLISGNIAVLALSQIKDKAYGSALYNFIAITTSVVATLVVGTISHALSFRVLSVTILLALLVMFIAFHFERSSRV